ncbi:hypothetical protein ACFTSF_01870 [Kribbella sp. NPDC056951]|uniref:hypothetical protein n=1 Tax=Kribbella sp. NPDC056951 TaxID=3345978 RepID=UPI003641AC79
MTFMDKTRCRAVANVSSALVPWARARHEKWGKQDVVVFDFLPGVQVVLMPVQGGAWLLGGATEAADVIGEWLPASLGVTAPDGGQIVAGTALASLMDRYHDIAVDETNSVELHVEAAERFTALRAIG